MRHARALCFPLLATWLMLAIVGAQAQSGCSSEPLCPDGQVPTGEFPQCNCDGGTSPEPPLPPPPEPEPPPLPPPEPAPPELPPAPLRCETHFACVDGQQVAFGEWPDCTCADLQTPIPPGPRPERGPGIPPGMGMDTDTCEMFFDCQRGFDMIVWNGKCVCREEMLPQPDD